MDSLRTAITVVEIIVGSGRRASHRRLHRLQIRSYEISRLYVIYDSGCDRGFCDLCRH